MLQTHTSFLACYRQVTANFLLLCHFIFLILLKSHHYFIKMMAKNVHVKVSGIVIVWEIWASFSLSLNFHNVTLSIDVVSFCLSFLYQWQAFEPPLDMSQDIDITEHANNDMPNDHPFSSERSICSAQNASTSGKVCSSECIGAVHWEGSSSIHNRIETANSEVYWTLICKMFLNELNNFSANCVWLYNFFSL